MPFTPVRIPHRPWTAVEKEDVCAIVEEVEKFPLEFEAQSGSPSGVGPPVFGTRATAVSLADLADFVVSYAIKNGVATILLN